MNREFSSFLILVVPEDSIELPITPAFALRGYLHTPAVILWSGKSRPRLFIHFSLPEEKQSPPRYQGIVARNMQQFRRFEGKPNTDVRTRER